MQTKCEYETINGKCAKKTRKKEETKFGGGRGRGGAGRLGTRWEDSYGKIYDKKKVFHWDNAKNLTISSRSLLFFYIFVYPVA